MLTNRTYKKLVKITMLPLIMSMLLMFPGGTMGNDTEIYSAGATVKPMVLIIVDNSGSMKEGLPYDSATPYSGTYSSNSVYQLTCKRNRWNMCISGTEKYTLVSSGTTFTDVYNSDTGTAGQDGVDDNNSTIKLGNRLNYDYGSNPKKIDVAKSVLHSLVDLMYDYVDFGFMKFGGGGKLTDGGNLISMIGATKEAMHGQITGINPESSTPLAEALTDAGKYFEDTYTGQGSPWKKDKSNWCQRAFVIIITDGEPACDTSTDILKHFLQRPMTEENRPNRPIPGTIPSNEDIGKYWDQDGDYKRYDYYTDARNNNKDNMDVWVEDNNLYYQEVVPQTFLDDVAHYLYRHDLRSDLQGTQNVTTYTIGFSHSSLLLQKTAENGGGLYYSANDTAGLLSSLLSALDDIAKKLQIYTAPVVPVTRTSSGDKMYLAFFKPMQYTKFWQGDVQKYGLSDDNRIVDSTGKAATDSSGAMLDEAVPYWSASKVLKARTSDRKIYTYIEGNTKSLTDGTNLFDTTNSLLTAGALGFDSSYTDPATSRDNLIKYLHGYDAYDEEGKGTTAKREHILGDILHSVPLVVDYAAYSASDPKRYIFFGSNDGMIHCLDDKTGQEEWAFVPPDVLPRLKLLREGTTHPLFCDGSIKLYQERDANGAITRAIIIFGERGGGNCYYAVDVTDIMNPVYLWKIDSSTGFSELGQTWSDPVICKIQVTSSDTAGVDVIIFGAGFDPAQADKTSVLAAAKGRGVYIANLKTGSLIKSYTPASTSGENTNVAGMLYSIPSSVLIVDKSNDGKLVDKIYVGDLGGNLWRIGAPSGKDNLMSSWIVRKLFKSLPTDGRKIYYPPDIGFEQNHDILLFGTGDRDNPRSETTVDRVYGIKDFNWAQAASETVETFAITESLLKDQTGVIYASTMASPTYGWYFRLTNTGEKMLASPTLFNGFLLATTFSPNNATCSVGGNAKLYAVMYKIGTYSYYTLGVGIPTEVVIVVRPQGVTGFVGAGGSVIQLGGGLVSDEGSPNKTPLEEVFDLPKGIIPISWRELF